MTPSPNDRNAAAEDGPLVLQIFRAFRIAVGVPQIAVAVAGLLVLSAGDWAIDQAPFAPESPPSPAVWAEPLLPAANVQPGGLASSRWSAAASRTFGLLLAPYNSVFEPTARLLSMNNTWSTAAYAWSRLLWALLVWGFFAAILTRTAAVSFAIDETIPLRSACGFGGRMLLPFLTAPLLPAAGILFFWTLMLVGGWVGRIPVAGPILLGVFLFLVLGFGFIAALLLLSVIAGWPLMYATIGTEVSDGFDGFSRSLSYVFGRPWAMLRYYAVGLVYGVACVAFVAVFAYFVVYVSAWGLAAGMGESDVVALLSDSPFSVVEDRHETSAEPLGDGPRRESHVSSTATAIAGVWLQAASLVVHAFGVSLFWTLATIVFFLLRYLDDATALDEVFLTPGDEPDDSLPVIGMAANEHPPVERPLDKDPGIRAAATNDDEGDDNGDDASPET